MSGCFTGVIVGFLIKYFPYIKSGWSISPQKLGWRGPNFKQEKNILKKLFGIETEFSSQSEHNKSGITLEISFLRFISQYLWNIFQNISPQFQSDQTKIIAPTVSVIRVDKCTYKQIYGVKVLVGCRYYGNSGNHRIISKWFDIKYLNFQGAVFAKGTSTSHVKILST